MPKVEQTNGAVKITPHSHDSLEMLYTTAERENKDLFSEMRSNLLLVSGEHYSKRFAAFSERVRTSAVLTEQQKLRLTKNHIQRISREYVDVLTSLVPGVGFRPKNEAEIQDQKVTEQHDKVWQDAKQRYKLREKIDSWAGDFVNIGEVNLFLFFDPDAGPIKGYEQKVDEEGNPEFDEFGQPVPDMDAPVFRGAFKWERLIGPNVITPPEAHEPGEEEYIITRKMVLKSTLLERYRGNPDKLKYIQETSDKTFVVFDQSRGGYRKSEHEVMVKTFFFRPSKSYPKGYFYMTTTEGVLEQGELPGGIFPIVRKLWDQLETTARGRSIVKHMRPYQAEINRTASKIAEHHITLGDDKILIQHGTKVAPGASLPGIRTVSYTGREPEILPGRDGSQYVTYMESQIRELYEVMNVSELMNFDKNPKKGDVYGLIFQAASQKKKFSRYVMKFESFLVEVAELYLKLAKIHLDDEELLEILGPEERDNLPEFRRDEENRYQVIVEPIADDVETKMGKQMVLNQTLQYVGNQLSKEDIGKLVRAMPYVNEEEIYEDFTMNYDSAKNTMLALERGEQPVVNIYDDHPYLINKLTNRMRKPDFKYLPQQVQELYQATVQMHMQAEAEKAAQIQRAQQGYIPTGGYLVTMDFYASDPKDPSKTKRLRLPYESILWLVKQLEAQGQTLEQLEEMNRGAMSQMAQILQQQSGQATLRGVPNGTASAGNTGSDFNQPGGPGGVTADLSTTLPGAV